MLQGLSLKRPVVVGKVAYGLYILDKGLVKEVKSFKDLSSSYSNLYVDCDKAFQTSCNHAIRQLSFDVWHKMVGHITYKKMRFLPLEFNFKDVKHDMPCSIYLRAKQQRLPFQLSSISTLILKLFIWIRGGHTILIKTYVRHRVFLTIVDDYTRATWTHSMVTEDEAIGLIDKG